MAFPSREKFALVGPDSGSAVLNQFSSSPYATADSGILFEGEVGRRACILCFHVSWNLARQILAMKRVEPATHNTDPYLWQGRRDSQREGFRADYGLKIPFPATLLIFKALRCSASRDYVASRLAPAASGK